MPDGVWAFRQSLKRGSADTGWLKLMSAPETLAAEPFGREDGAEAPCLSRAPVWPVNREPLRRFLKRQLQDVRRGGWVVLVRKIWLRLWGYLLLGPAAIAVLVVRALRPVVLIRFGWLRSERLGHFAIDTELYLCERDAGMQPSNALDVFYYRAPVCNEQLRRMFDRTLRVRGFARVFDETNRLLPGGEAHQILIRGRDVHGSRDVEGLLARFRPHLSFTAEEEAQGRQMLRQLGIREGQPVVCVYARDSAYLEAMDGARDWRYHDFRDSAIGSYLPAMEALASRGYVAIRMGKIVKEPLRQANPQVIDYATSRFRSDFLDIYLAATCRFFLGCPGGLVAIPMVFRRPVAFVNSIPLANTLAWGRGDLCIVKKLWLKRERRFLTFRETLSSSTGRFLQSEQYEQAGLEVVDNSPEEIAELAREMDERLKGTWRTTEEDDALQRRVWSLFTPNELNQVFNIRIGAAFLRHNQELLA